jgi:hypothetical protein
MCLTKPIKFCGIILVKVHFENETSREDVLCGVAVNSLIIIFNPLEYLISPAVFFSCKDNCIRPHMRLVLCKV